MPGIPVTIHLAPSTFKAIETVAATRGVSMRSLIEAQLDRAVTRKRAADAHDALKHKRRLGRTDLERIHAMSERGFTGAEIAAELHCHERTVQDWRRKFRENGYETTMSRLGTRQTTNLLNRAQETS